MVRTLALAPILALLPLVGGPPEPAGPVGTANLLADQVNLGRLAEYPEPAFSTWLFSSHERVSDDPAEHASWHANHDRGFCHYEATIKEPTPYFSVPPRPGQAAAGTFSTGTRVGIARNRPAVGEHVWVYAAERRLEKDGRRQQGYVPRACLVPNPEGVVLAEVEGPGALVRFWAANPSDAGRVRIFLDGNDQPAVEAPLSDLLAGRWRTEVDGQVLVAFPSPWAGLQASGWNLDFPLPFAKSCKVTVEKPGLAYQIVCRTYPPLTPVRTFQRADLPALQPTLAKLREEHWLPRQASQELAQQAASIWSPQPERLPPGSVLAADLQAPGGGAGAIVAQQWQVEPMKAEVLRGLLLRLTMDGEPEPAVLSPLGDFFASAPGASPFRSLPIHVTPDGRMQAFWTMPFRRGVRLELRNESGEPVTVTPVVRIVARPWTARSLYFHARWRADWDQPTRPLRELTRCEVAGRGQFVGLALCVANAGREWWGEGDEKIYIDEERHPRWFGTGTDDYFGAAWASADRFETGLRGRTVGRDQDHAGWSSLYRFHLLDAIPFQQRFRFDQELHAWDPKSQVSISSVAYWYAAPGARTALPMPRAEDLRRWPLPPRLP